MDEQQHDEKLDHEVEFESEPAIEPQPVEVDPIEAPAGDQPVRTEWQPPQPAGASPEQLTRSPGHGGGTPGVTPGPARSLLASPTPPLPPRTPTEVMIDLLREGARTIEPTGLERLRLRARMQGNGHADH